MGSCWLSIATVTSIRSVFGGASVKFLGTTTVPDSVLLSTLCLPHRTASFIFLAMCNYHDTAKGRFRCLCVRFGGFLVFAHICCCPESICANVQYSAVWGEGFRIIPSLRHSLCSSTRSHRRSAASTTDGNQTNATMRAIVAMDVESFPPNEASSSE